jgi:iron complex transport system substrate-binding protein
VLALLLVAGCGEAAPPAGARTVADSRGKAVRVPARPERIVSIVPSVTELLFAVGAGGQVAGVTTWCDFPPEAKAKPKVGDIVVDLERLLALRPDLVVTVYSLTRKTTADLESRGLPVFSIEAENFEGIARALEGIGELTGHAEEGKRAAVELMKRVEGASSPAPSGPTIYFEHSVEPLGTTGPASYAGAALRRAGGRNIFDGGWRQVDWESVVAADPEVIVITHDRREGLERRAGWKGLRAVRNGRVHFLPKEFFVYPTPRLVDGLEAASRIFRAKNP